MPTRSLPSASTLGSSMTEYDMTQHQRTMYRPTIAGDVSF